MERRATAFRADRLDVRRRGTTAEEATEMQHPLDELKAYVGFGDADVERLQALRPHVMPHAVKISEHFYEIILLFPDATAVFEDMAQVERLKKTLVRWIEQALTGPYDVAYYELRRRIGRVHVEVGLPSQYMFTAMNRLMDDIHQIALEAFKDDAAAVAQSLRRITDIELAIMLSTYIESREQTKMESLRDLIISHLRTTVLLIDGARRVVTSTTPQNELFAQREIVGLPLGEAFDPLVMKHAGLDERLSRALASGREVVVPRVEVPLAGGVRTLRIGVIPLHHAAADALVQIEDLTETLAAETRANRAEHLAKLGTMAASVAHEIRNPLAGISGTVQFIAGSLPQDDMRVEALTEVQSQIARLGTLVGDLLNFSRPITAEAGPADLALIAHNAVVQATASEGKEAVVEGAGIGNVDSSLLGQVLLNLVQNAWQAGAQQVVVRVEDARVLVCDDGPGIPDENRAKVFEPFFTTKVRGTGLGLPVAKKVVEAMGGTLSLSESPLGGAAFAVTLQAADLG